MPKKIIICADGTWNKEDETDQGHPCPTNVVKIARALRQSNAQGVPQVVHYESGIGTNWGFRLRGGGLGRGMWANILDCYRFLVHNYAPGDSIYLFGFSRGAFTVRSLAGLIRNSGILKRGHEGYEHDAIELYRDYDPKTTPDSETCKQFRADHCCQPEPGIDFLGVWDTVGALGIPGMDGSFRLLKGLDWQFHDATLSTKVKCARHALAIHEHRASFVPTLWEQKPGMPPEQLEQVWFAGAHSDVGGGYKEHALSDIALQWMVEEAQKAGLEFGMDALPAFAPDPLGESHDSFGALSKVMSFFRGEGFDGAPRVYGLKPELTRQSIHPSASARFKARSKNSKLKDEPWPESFRKALEG